MSISNDLRKKVIHRVQSAHFSDVKNFVTWPPKVSDRI